MRLLRFAWRAVWGLFMLAVVAVVGVLGWQWLRNAATERRSAIALKWEDQTFEQGWKPPTIASLKTRCADGMLQYQVELRRTQDEAFDGWPMVDDLELVFRDADGFEIREVPLPLSEWSSYADLKGWNLQAGYAVDCAEYLRIVEWTLAWRTRATPK